MALALVLAVLNRLILAPIMIVAGLVITLTGLDKHVVLATIFGLGIGFAVGVLIGAMVAKIGIPSFVVTLALFLTWQGVVLFALKSQPLDVTRYNFWYGLAQNTMTPFWGWVYFAVVVGTYLVVTLVRATRRHAEGLSADTLALVLLRAGAIALGGAIVVIFFNQNRNPNVGEKIEGLPWALTIPLTLMIGATIVLTKTTWGRHLYAAGGNAEAARRAGIKVDQIKMSAFALCSGFAALGGFFLSSYTGGVQLDLGGGNTLLFAVAAAVIGGTSFGGGASRGTRSSARSSSPPSLTASASSRASMSGTRLSSRGWCSSSQRPSTHCPASGPSPPEPGGPGCRRTRVRAPRGRMPSAAITSAWCCPTCTVRALGRGQSSPTAPA
jgi:D-xylose transport system permease protein